MRLGRAGGSRPAGDEPTIRRTLFSRRSTAPGGRAAAALRAALAAALLGGVLAGCDGVPPETVVGSQGQLGEGQAFTWARLGKSRELVEFGVTFPIAVLDKLPEGTSLALELPAEVQSQTTVRNVLVEYRQRPFLPRVYQVPRLDVRFYSITAIEREAISCIDEPMPPPTHLPPPYVIQSTKAEPEGLCVARIGVHAYDAQAPELNPANNIPFSNTQLLGYHAGRLVFVQAAMPLAEAARGKGFDAKVPRPPDLAPSVLWPTQSMVVTNGPNTTLNFSLVKLRPGE